MNGLMNETATAPALRRIIILLAGLLVTSILTLGAQQPAYAQDNGGAGNEGTEEKDEAGLGTKARLAGEAFWDGLTLGGGDSGGDEGSGTGGQSSDGSGEGSGEGNPGGGVEGPVNLPDASGEAQNGEYGPWTGIINVLQTLLVGASGIGVLLGLAVIATAGPRSDRHQLGIHLLEGAGAGLLIGLSAEPLYALVMKLVVGL